MTKLKKKGLFFETLLRVYLWSFLPCVEGRLSHCEWMCRLVLRPPEHPVLQALQQCEE